MRITPTDSLTFNLDGHGFGYDCEIVIKRTDHELPTGPEA